MTLQTMSGAKSIMTRLFLSGEQMALNSYTKWTGKNWIFNDRIWHDAAADDFEMYQRARQFLGLKPFAYEGKKSVSDGGWQAWHKFRYPRRRR